MGKLFIKQGPVRLLMKEMFIIQGIRIRTITYAIVDGWPGTSIFVDHVTPKRGSDIILLGYDHALDWKLSKSGVTIQLPEILQKEENRPCKQAYAFKIIGKQQ